MYCIVNILLAGIHYKFKKKKTVLEYKIKNSSKWKKKYKYDLKKSVYEF